MTREEITSRITRLKKEKNAIILAHYYTRPEIQDIADFLGDSLGLSKMAAGTDADTIIFCGVHFMAETAAIISPEKKVLSPAPDAGCSLADSIKAEDLKKWKQAHPDGIVVSYVNTTAEVKAWTDYCCTSSNALKVIESLPKDKEILFCPDNNLGNYIMQVTGRKMEIWEGCCKVHQDIDSEMISKALQKYPEADILIHPEARCSHDRDMLSDGRVFFYSTAGILSHSSKSGKETFVIGTETDTLHQLRLHNPSKNFIPVSDGIVCKEMKKVTLEKVLDCLENGSGQVVIDPAIRERALLPIQRMMEI